MPRWNTGLAALAAVVLGAAAASAADDGPAAVKPSQGAYAVIVGVGDTADKTIQPRPTADADAKALYDLLADPKYFDAAPGRVKLLTSTADEARKGKAATRENIIAAVHEAVDKTGKDDILVIAFFGRGASAADRTCLFAADSTFKDRAKNGVLGTDLEAELKPAKPQKLCFLMDVSYKGYDAGKETLIEPTLKDILGGVFGGEDKGEQPLPHDRLLMLATVPAADPLTKGEHGLFAATLVDALKGAADTDGYEPDGLVTADELTKYIEKEVQDQARTLGKTAKEKEAVPYIVGEEVSHFAFTKNPKLTDAVAKRAAAVAALEAGGKLTKEEAAEGKQLLTRMPKLKALQDLRKKYQALADGTLAPADFAVAVKAVKESMVLGEEAADEYVDKVMRAIKLVESRYVKPVTAADLTVNAVRGTFGRLEETVPPDVDDLLKKSKEWKDDKDQMRAALKAARLKLGKREDLDGNKDADTSIAAMLAGLNDPYTVYFDKETIKKIESQFRGEFSGVGIQIRRDLVNDALLVVSPIKNSPAYKAGIQAGDLIVGIKRTTDPEGKPLTSDQPTEFTTKGMKTETALEIILGTPGIPITLLVEHDKEVKEYTIKRGRVTVETVLGTKRDAKDNWSYWLDADAKVAYVHLTQFAPSTAGELEEVLIGLKKAGMKGLVLDLRGNPGGVLSGAAAICSMFIDDGKVVTVRPRVAKEEVLRSEMFRPREKFTNFPMAVLVNGNSASASEIVSACLQDYERAVIVGERSYGKGSVQTVEQFRPTAGQIKMTTARYFPPGDRNIDKHSTSGKPEDEWGVKPDKGFEVKLTREELREFADHLRDHEIIPRKDAKPDPDKKEFKDAQLAKAAEYVKEHMKTAGK